MARFLLRAATAALLAAPLAPPVLAGVATSSGGFPTTLTAEGRQRLEGFDALREQAMARAAEAPPADRRVLERALSGTPQRLAPAHMAGEWRCRSIQFGPRGVTVYGEFRCRITDDAAGLRLEKLTGSQRQSGTFHDIGEARLGYLGAAAWGDGEGPRRYGEDPERDQAGYLVPLSASHLRLEYVSRFGFDMLDLRR
ncbi:DUF4893 domain-containing protein [Pseudoroseomonas cervicalis]|uniref:DUF4893 domain-containing protein n=1 Tax=Pseudoroseomonas cervicalis ATCC 49957 TaxID=525371 RepID=D5RN17_9PROT|nr:DUF4893 domain-containing protein [Pseudoroseomonas cervicalis]EFH11284.1 hypothetical protein HMPREF0731_2478 [Pseudoroseomonas cervicalis ATCC 49957]